MITKPITAILAAALLVSASGTVSSIYFMSSEEVDLTDGSAFILQGIDANQSTTTAPEGTSIFFDVDNTALHTLGDLLELSTAQVGNATTTTTTNATSISERNLLVALEDGGLVNGTMSLECEGEIIAQGRINGTIGTFGASPGTYNGCTISISDDEITDTGEIDELIVVSDSEEDYQNSLVTSETANEEGTFESSVTVPNVEGGEYAILAVADDARTAVSALSVTVAETVTEPAANATEDIVNETITQVPGEEELAEEESTELLTVGIIPNGTEGVAPATFEFEANITGGTEPYTYLWDFGDGSEESDEQTVLHTFEEAGIYNVVLTITDENGEEASDNLEITVNEPSPTIAEPLTVGIISNSTEGVAPATFEFQANLTGGTEPYTYLWDFGDGSEESDEQTVLHTFEEAGIYNVTLTATDTDDQDASASIEISVEEAPPALPPTIAEPLTVGIISNSTEGVAPATFEFEANITGGTEPYAISWNFGDGSEESDEQTVLHTFEEAGIYNVVLTITDENGEEASDNLEITVNEPSPTIAEPLTAEIISNSTEGVAPATFEFQANLTGGTEPYTYLWDFGDGSEESDEQTVLHTFEEAGIYNVTLTATDTDDQDASASIEISVEEAPPALPPTIAEPLTVGIISNSTEGVAPATFEFEANITGGTEPYAISWNFGDGSEESDEQTVLHTFEEAGIYNVVLTITDENGEEASDNLEITVNEPSPTIAEPLTVGIISNSTEGVAPATFEEAGIYNVTLTATDTDDQDASASIEISVEEAPAEVVEEEGEATTTTVQNQTQNNQTGTAGEEEPTVQLDETSAEPGSPIAISGEGFQPDIPIQIFINNVQITNVLTNVEGSFNTVVIVPTTVAAGSAQVVVRTEQTTIVQNVNIIQLDGGTEVPSTLRLTAVSATDNGEALPNAPVSIFDASSGEVVERGRTPMDIELPEGTYSIFYSDFGRFEFESAEPGRWIDTPDGGSGLITIREGRNTTVTALYSEQPAPPPPPRVTDNSLTLRTQDTQGNPIQGMFVTIYNAEAAEKIEQGFTELRVDDLPPGTYPVFFSNFEDLEFLSASPGTWIQTPFGGVGLVTIPDDGEDHNIVVTAEYNRTTVVEEEQFNIQAPLDLEGNIFTITSNQTRPEGPFVMSGTFALRVSDEEPVSATLSAFFMSAREDSNENVDLESQRSRDHDTFQIVDLKPSVARPIGLNSYVVSGTADLLLNGDMYSNDERIVVIVRGGEELTPTNVEIDFRGDQRYSAANRLDTLYGVVSSGFQ